MTDLREVLARRIVEAIKADEDFDRFGFIDSAYLSSVSIDGQVNMLATVDALLAGFLVVPRSDIVDTEYAVQYDQEGGRPGRVYRRPNLQNALGDARNLPGIAMQRPVLPWTPIPLPGEES